jgi:hypothetical protein
MGDRRPQRAAVDRLADGQGCTRRTVDAAADWFRANWPPHVIWPLAASRQSPAVSVAREDVRVS